MTIYNFQTQLAIGKEAESQLDLYFSQFFVIEQVNLSIEKEQGYDRIFIPKNPNKPKLQVEYKADFKSLQTGNAYIEYLVYSDTYEKLGWALHTQADIVVYALMRDNLLASMYNISVEKMKGAFEYWSSRFRHTECRNPTWKSKGLLVPLSELERVCLTVTDVKQ